MKVLTDWITLSFVFHQFKGGLVHLSSEIYVNLEAFSLVWEIDSALFLVLVFDGKESNA